MTEPFRPAPTGPNPLAPAQPHRLTRPLLLREGRLSRQGEAPFVVAAADPKKEALVASVDKGLSDAMRGDQSVEQLGEAILAFLAFVEEQRCSLPASDWAAKFGRVHSRITTQVLPVFSDAVIADARWQMESERLYLPPEARA